MVGGEFISVNVLFYRICHSAIKIRLFPFWSQIWYLTIVSDPKVQSGSEFLVVENKEDFALSKFKCGVTGAKSLNPF